MTAEKTSITITIRGKKYPFRTEADNQRVQQVVELVNSKLDELDRQSGLQQAGGVTEIRLLMLALLNFVDECLTCQQSLSEIKERSKLLLDEIASVGF
ncbi:MAG: cell division protein ZapA [Deltaproteobacteria bacterium]|nr:cell division protein ZapA [Deltaproteobacteria bacterium]